jgi:alpha-beta hydrolase superfamily lysophospholipase
MIVLMFFVFPSFLWGASFETITFPSKDGLTITADLYQAHKETAPFILLFHQAGWSRGEYREIAPKLVQLGFNCMAVDQRSGEGVNQVANETVKQAGKSGTYLDALQDMEASVQYVNGRYAKGKLILWGSSYSASLALVVAAQEPSRVHAVLAFAPGEYFEKLGQSGSFIKEKASQIKAPVFITSAKSEKDAWFSIYQAIPSEKKTYFLPDHEGRHGSSALWASVKGHEDYWKAVEVFLSKSGLTNNLFVIMSSPCALDMNRRLIYDSRRR